MKFSGAIGALIVVLALLGTSLGAIILNVDVSTEATVEYDYVTDVSGLYDYSDVPEYLDYDPASNYTGYSRYYTGPTSYTYSNADIDRLSKVDLSSITYLEVEYNFGTKAYNARYTINGETTYINHLFTDAWPGGWAVFACSSFYVQGDWYSDYTTPSGMSSGTIRMATSHTEEMSIYVNNSPIVINRAISDLFIYDPNGSYVYSNGYGSDTIYVDSSSNVYFWNSNNGTLSSGTNAPMTAINSNGSFQYNRTVYSLQLSNNTGNYSQLRYIVPYQLTVNYKNLAWGPGIEYEDTGGVVNSYKITDYSNSTSTNSDPSLNPDNIPQISHTNVAAWVTYTAYNNCAFDSSRIYEQCGFSTNYKLITLASYIDALNLSNNVINTKITFDYGYDSQTFYKLIGGTTQTYRLIKSPIIYTDASVINLSGITYKFLTGSERYYKNIEIDYTPGNATAAIIDEYGSGTYNINTTYIVYHCGTSFISDYNGSVETHSISTSFDDHLTTSTASSYYMDITAGVKINAENNNFYVKWSNDVNGDLENGEIDLIFRASPGEARNNIIRTPDNEKITISYDGTNMYIQYGTNAAVDLGRWNAGVLQLDFTSKMVRFQPAYMFESYTTFQTIGDVITCFSLPNSSGSAKYLIYDYTANSFIFSVYNTKVYLGTNSLIMNSPSIDILDYFTEYEDYRVIIKNFAIIGNTITINDEILSLSGNNITIDNTDNSISLGMIITYENDKCAIEFISTNNRYDLGSVTNNEISFSGQWYFNTDLYKGHDTTQEVFDWDFDNSEFLQPTDEKVIIFCALCIAGLATCAYFLKPSIIDWIIVAVALVLALAAFIGW